MKRATLLSALAFSLSTFAGAASAAISGDVVKIGVMTDLSGVYLDYAGKGSVEAAKLAIEDFGNGLPGKKIELVTADHQNKADIGSAKAREWIDRDGVDAIVDLPNSSVALGRLAHRVGEEAHLADHRRRQPAPHQRGMLAVHRPLCV